MSPTASIEPALKKALGSSRATLRRLAAYSLPTALDRRILELGERQETLTSDERSELLAWVDFTQARSAEKLEAELALRRLDAIDPDLAEQP